MWGSGASPFFGEGGGDAPFVSHMSEVHKDWKSVLEVYAGHPHDAFILAQLLKQLKEHVEGGPSGRRETLAQLEFAIRTLHQYTGFNKVSRRLYRLAVAGKLSGKHYEKLRELGMKF